MASQPPTPPQHEPPGITIAGTWWLLGAVAVLASLPALTSRMPAGTRAGTLVLVVAVFLAGVPGMGRIATVVAPFAVLAVGLGSGSQFWPNRLTFLLLAVGAAFSAGCSAALRVRLEGMVSHAVGLGRRADSRAIRDVVEDALATRRRDNYVDRELVRASRYGRELSIAVAAIDNLQLLRQHDGQDAVQMSLACLGELFSNDTRLPDGGVGENLELVFVLPETPLLGGRVVAERVRLGFQSLVLPGADEIPLTVSIGVSASPADGQRAEDVLGAARAALGRAQARGGNRTMLSRSPAGTPAGWSGV